jgi:hypothetical protein
MRNKAVISIEQGDTEWDVSVVCDFLPTITKEQILNNEVCLAHALALAAGNFIKEFAESSKATSIDRGEE